MFTQRLNAIVLAAIALSSLGVLPACAGAPKQDSYDITVLADHPSAYWSMGHSGSASEPDLSGSGLSGKYVGSPGSGSLPNGSFAAVFDGQKQYFEVADAAQLSPATTGVLTLEAWMRPDTTEFAHTESTGYVHWMGKLADNSYEYVARMYSGRNTEGRANRVSGYLFNRRGGLGAGSYFQDPVRAGSWIYYVLVINRSAVSKQYPHGYTKIYKDGVLRDQDDLSIDGTVIVPRRGTAPFRVATGDLESFFRGAVGKVALYDKELASSRIAAHFAAMVGRFPSRTP